MTLVFLDTETTGLDPFVHDVWEIAWSVDADPVIQSEILVHTLKTADPEALELNGYWKRFPKGARSRGPGVDLELRKLLEGVTIVGANPTFDAAFLQHRWRAQPWHYRLIDISSMAVQAFGDQAFVERTITDINGDDVVVKRPPGLYDVRQLILAFYAANGINWKLPEPDHTAAGDVATLKACYFALQARVNWRLEPKCTCPLTDPLERAGAYTVARFNLEPHAAGCPRWGRKKEAA